MPLFSRGPGHVVLQFDCPSSVDAVRARLAPYTGERVAVVAVVTPGTEYHTFGTLAEYGEHRGLHLGLYEAHSTPFPCKTDDAIARLILRERDDGQVVEHPVSGYRVEIC